MRSEKVIGRVLIYLAIGVAGAFFLFPIYWMVATSFKGPILMGGSEQFIFKPSLTNYEVILKDWKLMAFFKNSAIVTLSSTLITVLAGTLAAYSLVRLHPAGKNFIAFEFLSLRAVPPIVALIPLYLLARMLNIQGSRVYLIVIYATMNLPIAIWVMAGFIRDLPLSIEESALIDGCTRLAVFRRIVVPLVVPGLAATSIICAIFAWNEFMFASIITLRATKTLPVIIALSMKEYSIAWGAAFAGGVIVAAPVIVMGVLAQRYLVSGLTFGAIRG